MGQSLSSTRSCRLRKRKPPRCAVGKTSTMRCRFAGTIAVIQDVGDGSDHDILVQTDENGDIVVKGLNDTKFHDFFNAPPGEFTTSVTLSGAGLETLALNMGDGNDSVKITNFTLARTSEFNSRFQLDVFGGNGNDTIDINNTTLSLEATSGVGTARAGLQVRGENGDDTIRISNTTVEADGATNSARLSVRGGVFRQAAGDDNIHITNVHIAAQGGTFSNEALLSIEDTCGTVKVVNSSASLMQIFTGSGNDSVKVVNSSASFSINLGGGDDSLKFINNSGFANLRGGAGFDSLVLKNNIGTINVFDFEDIND